MKNKDERKNRGRFANEKGMILITAYVLVASLMTAASSFFIRSFQDFQLAERRVARIQAAYAAETGAEQAFHLIRYGRMTPTSLAIGVETPINGVESAPMEGSSGMGGSYTIDSVTQDTNDSEIFWIVSTGTINSVSRTVTLAVRMTQFYKYAMVIGAMGSDGYFSTGHVINGDLHVNGLMRVFGAPEFKGGKVSHGAAGIYNYYYDNYYYNGVGGRPPDPLHDPQWLNGDPVNQPALSMPPTDVSYVKDMDGIQTIAGGHSMYIAANGNYYVTATPIDHTNLPDVPTGTLEGKRGFYFQATDALPFSFINGVIPQKLLVASNKQMLVGQTAYDCEISTQRAGFDPDGNPVTETVFEPGSCPMDSEAHLTVMTPEDITFFPVGGIPGQDSESNTQNLSGYFMATSGKFKAFPNNSIPAVNLAINGGIAVKEYDSLVTAIDQNGNPLHGYMLNLSEDSRKSGTDFEVEGVPAFYTHLATYQGDQPGMNWIHGDSAGMGPGARDDDGGIVPEEEEEEEEEEECAEGDPDCSTNTDPPECDPHRGICPESDADLL